MTVSIDDGGSNVIKGGPATQEGKEVVRWNATRHGIRSPAPLVPGVEKAEDWERHRAGVLESLSPEGHLEEVLAERVALLSWKLNRVTRYETESIALSQEEAEDDLADRRRFDSYLLAATHPDDDELRLLAGQKNNLSLPPESLVYRIEAAENGAARIVYEGVSEATAGQLLRVPVDEEEKSVLTEAKEFLESELNGRRMAMKAVERNASEAGISPRTLKRAKQALGVKSVKQSDGSWTWSLPEKEAKGGQSPTDGPVGTVGPLGKDASPKPDDYAYLREEGQGDQEGQGDHDPSCIHGHHGGAGCYLCDPRHPYRVGQAERGRHSEVTQRADAP
jgi:hypothetical protein